MSTKGLLGSLVAASFLLAAACPGRTPIQGDAGADEPSRSEPGSGTANESSESQAAEEPAAKAPRAREAERSEPDLETLRRNMVETQIIARGITEPRVIEAMLRVPRHEFVPGRYRSHAYADHPLPIGEDQTISQPLIVALMSKLARVGPGDKVLEIGTGSGYHAAVLAEMGPTVYTIEIIEPLGRGARLVLAALGYENIHVKIGDGYRGWPEHAPFDAIVVTAAPPSVPQPLLEQLAVGGRMVLPVGEREQELEVITRTETGFEHERHGAVRFVPMTGEAQQ